MTIHLLSVILIVIFLQENSFSYLEDKLTNTLCGSEILYSKDTSCHFTETNDDILPVDKARISKLKNSIFFIETSCNGGLNFRQACSVEAAALAHPDRNIIVLFAGPVVAHCLYSSPMSDVLRYDNVQFYRVHIRTFLMNTPLAALPASGHLMRSKNAIHYTSVMLRFATLYKFGGMYLDLDMIVKDNLDKLPSSKNWIGKSSVDTLGISALALSRRGVGHDVTLTTMRILASYVEPEFWDYDIANAFKEALQNICNISNVDKVTPFYCRGLAIYDVKAFYPFPESSWNVYFKKYDPEKIPEESHAFHLWNSQSQNETIYSDSLYAYLIFHLCPQISRIMM